jgi:hypothetical protein
LVSIKKRQSICDHSHGSGIMLCEERKNFSVKLYFVCIHCRESVQLPEYLWQRGASKQC